MTIEEYIVGFLNAAQDVPASGSVPHPLPEEFITVELTGERVANLIPAAQIHINAYSVDRAASAELARQIYAVMQSMSAQPEISRVGLNSMFNDADLELNRPRAAAIYEVVYLFTEE